MKRLYILTTLVSALFIAACSKSFLDREPEGSYVDATFYTSPEALKAATAPLYNRAWFDYNKRPAVAIGSLRANDAYNPWMNPSYTLFTVTSLDDGLSDSWKSFYGVITMANATIEAINNKAKNVTDAQKNLAIAEARLMRGISYFFLLRTWGPVILIESNEEVIKNPLLPRHREEDVFQFIINDLLYAVENLPSTWDKGRATSWGAKGMLAKVYLARSGWKKGGTRDEADLAKAREYAGDVCMNSGLALYPKYEDLFKYKHNNNPESLIAMQWVPLGDWGVCNTLLADLAFSSDVTGGVNVWGGGLNGTIDILKLYERADSLRRNATYFTQYAHYPYISIDKGGYTYTGTGSSIKKGVVGGPNDDNDGYVQSMNSPLNTYILRLADVYLTFAEASLGNNNSLDGGEGLTYFNKVRERAKIGRKTAITLEDIIAERRVEFAMEYNNWYDMVSWYCYKPEKMLKYFNDQQRGWTTASITKDEDGNLVFEEPTPPTAPVVVTKDNIFFPYPENDLIQNPRLKEEPQPYTFNE
ncbi:RagB/SusD family nutrient uptake outer membrane protein [Olivibacter sp. CPCC 100613]|uniref:RagB/SusD family nutrient uptake outer membrane protein n=1 Tax=Olivibacter sp. CPCC 100613 TaxID=3079931 RepID=UPI002FF77F1F